MARGEASSSFPSFVRAEGLVPVLGKDQGSAGPHQVAAERQLVEMLEDLGSCLGVAALEQLKPRLFRKRWRASPIEPL